MTDTTLAMPKRFNAETDRSLSETLKVMEKAGAFNRYVYDTIRPFCNGNILEAGSGIGTISQFFLNDGASIMLSDVQEAYCSNLKTRFSHLPNLLGVETIDLAAPDFDSRLQKNFNSFDTIFALNVVEHIADDHLAVQNCYKLLKKGGRLIILVPAYPQLYTNLDVALGHYRRYTIKTLLPLFTESKFHIIHKQYFNAIGLLGWYVSGKLQKNQIIPKGQMSLYNKLVPLFKLIDKLTFHAIGLSVIAVGEK